eukprot:364781-Chlamydomonas_euryale.AAC.11
MLWEGAGMRGIRADINKSTERVQKDGPPSCPHLLHEAGLSAIMAVPMAGVHACGYSGGGGALQALSHLTHTHN